MYNQIYTSFRSICTRIYYYPQMSLNVNRRVPYGESGVRCCDHRFVYATRISPPRKIGPESVQNHSGMHVLRGPGVDEMGARRGRRHRTNQICVRLLRFQCRASTKTPCFSYENGIQTFDTANVSCGEQHLFFAPCNYSTVMIL